MASTTDDLVRRLERVERENRFFKGVGAVMLVGIVVVVIMGQARSKTIPKIIEAEEFVLRDGQKERAKLFARDGTVSLRLSDKEEQGRLVLLVSSSGSPGLYLFNSDGKNTVQLSSQVDGGAVMRLNYEDQKAGVGMHINQDTTPNMSLFDKSGKPRANLTLLRDEAAFSLFDARNKGGMFLSVSDSLSRVRLTDVYGKDRLVLLLKEGEPAIGIMDASGTAAWGVTDKGSFGR